MALPSWLRRGLAGTFGAIGLAYPACAAICPRGKGYCPYPGRCFLYTDVDTNSLCDYTPRTGTTPVSTTSSISPASQTADATSSAVSSAPIRTAAGTTTITPDTSSAFSLPDPGSLSAILPEALLIGILAGILLLGLFFCAFRRGWFGIKIEKTGPALAAASLFGLGISEMIAFVLLENETTASLFAVVYMLAGTLLSGYLWKSGCMSRPIAIGTVAMSTLFGFVILAPLMPLEFVGLIGILVNGQTLAPGILGIIAGILLVFVFGRTFCGHLCPVGSIQELAWNVPCRKITLRQTRILEVVRLVLFVATVSAALFMVSLMEYTGIYDFFSLTLSAGIVVFLLLLALSLFLYRPVCRGICPFGVLFSIPAHVSLYRLRRTERCINCKKCERACPAHVAGRDASKRECYLCARCIDACPVKGALVYGKGH